MPHTTYQTPFKRHFGTSLQPWAPTQHLPLQVTEGSRPVLVTQVAVGVWLPNLLAPAARLVWQGCHHETTLAGPAAGCCSTADQGAAGRAHCSSSRDRNRAPRWSLGRAKVRTKMAFCLGCPRSMRRPESCPAWLRAGALQAGPSGELQVCAALATLRMPAVITVVLAH